MENINMDLIMKFLLGGGFRGLTAEENHEFTSILNRELRSNESLFILGQVDYERINSFKRRITNWERERRIYEDDTLRFARQGRHHGNKTTRKNLNNSITRMEEQLRIDREEEKARVIEEEKQRIRNKLEELRAENIRLEEHAREVEMQRQERRVEEMRVWAAAHPAEAAARAAARAAAALAGVEGGIVDSMHVHDQARKYRKFIPGILSIIQSDIGVKDYSDIISHIKKTVGKFLRTDEEYLKYKFNSGIQTRDQWLADYSKVIQRLSSNIAHATKEQKDMMGYIIDCVFKYDLQSCFCRGFIYDTAHAYDGNAQHEEYGSTVSCWAGSVERVLTTFINCIKGVNEPVIVKINNLIEEKKDEVKSWEQLDKSTQVSYIRDWNNFFEKWVTSKVSNNSVKRLNSNSKKVSIMAAFKASRGNSQLPSYVEDYIKNELLREIVWDDYGFNSENGGQGGAEGGRRRRTRHKRNKRKTVRKHKKSLKRR
jgi:hypothetical protein